jgi:hydrophobe/amphiphile efflux-1 (HAE1) family protein
LDILKKIEHHYLEDEKASVDSLLTVAGFSFAGSGQNVGLAFVRLKPWDERILPDQQLSAIIKRSYAAFGPIVDAVVFPFAPPAVSELGNASGFDFMLQDRGNLGHEKLMAARDQLLSALTKEKVLVGVRVNGLDDTAEYQLELDDQKLTALGVSIADVNDTLSIALGGRYVNDFIEQGRVKKVFLKADAPFRMLPDDINDWYVRNSMGNMVSFQSFTNGNWIKSSPRLARYNGFPAVEIMGMALPGALSSGQAMDLVEKHASELPEGIGYQWTGMSFQEKQAGSKVTILYSLSILIVFLCLAALYESWAIPFSVISAVPLGILGALIGAVLTWKMNDVYFQVGVLTTVGLTSKNAILIVEFAKELVAKGMAPIDAAIQAAGMRLRPILMTSLAFILGVYPMMVSTGAGSGAQNALGTAVIGGMISGTLLTILFIPLFFVLVQSFIRPKNTSADQHNNAQLIDAGE